MGMHKKIHSIFSSDHSIGSTSTIVGTSSGDVLEEIGYSQTSVSDNLVQRNNAGNIILDSDTTVFTTDSAVSKAYVDAVSIGLDFKESCRTASTANIADLTNASATMDGVTLVADDRVLLKDQTSAYENGIYVFDGTSTFTRASDAGDSEMSAGMFTFIEEGTSSADTGWVLSTNNPITLDTTDLTYVQFSSTTGNITAGAGLSGSNTFNVNVDDSSIQISNDTLQVKALGVTNAMLAGTIANAKLANSSIGFGGVSVALGASDATPAFDLTDATNYPTSALTGTITNAQLAGSIANDKLANTTVSFGGVSVALGASDATPAFDLADATGYTGDSAFVTAGTITSGTWSATDVAVLHGGTGASTAADARTNLGLVIGTNVQAFDAQLSDIAALAIDNGNFIVADGANWVAESGSTARTSLGLGNVENTALSTWAGTANITTLGTIATGTWQGTTIANDYLVGNGALTVTAGDGLKTGGSVALGAAITLDIDLNELTAAAVAVGTDSIAIIDATDNGSKKESIADLATAMAGDAITATAGVFAVGVDDSSIETSGDALRVKASGITNAMLAGSIASSKIAEIDNFSTTNLSEGNNLYYTTARWDTKMAAADTDDLSEGASNLYHTDARSLSALSKETDITLTTSAYPEISDLSSTFTSGSWAWVKGNGDEMTLALRLGTKYYGVELGEITL